MNGFLVETNVLSEFNKAGGSPNVGVPRWLQTTARDLQFVSVITLAEIQKGIGLLAEGQRRRQLQQWLRAISKVGFQGESWQSTVPLLTVGRRC